MTENARARIRQGLGPTFQMVLGIVDCVGMLEAEVEEGDHRIMEKCGSS